MPKIANRQALKRTSTIGKPSERESPDAGLQTAAVRFLGESVGTCLGASYENTA